MMHSIRRPLAVVLAALLMTTSVSALAGCGNEKKASKTEIALRLGLAYGAFKHWVYTPATEGAFKAGAPKRKRKIAKAVLAAGFAAHELRKALQEAKQDPKLAKFATQIATTAGSLGGLGALLKSGGSDVTALTSGFGSVTSLIAGAKKEGIDVQEKVPSASQLALQ